MKLFIGCLLLMVYVLTLAYKGSLNAVLTVTFFPKPMDTIQEIANQVSFILDSLQIIYLNEIAYQFIISF